MTRLVLPCGCVVLVDHKSGDRLATCGGGGETPKNGSIARESLVKCPGGRQYRVTAEPVAQVRYAIEPLRKAKAS